MYKTLLFREAHRTRRGAILGAYGGIGCSCGANWHTNSAQTVRSRPERAAGPAPPAKASPRWVASRGAFRVPTALSGAVAARMGTQSTRVGAMSPRRGPLGPGEPAGETKSPPASEEAGRSSRWAPRKAAHLAAARLTAQWRTRPPPATSPTRPATSPPGHPQAHPASDKPTPPATSPPGQPQAHPPSQAQPARSAPGHRVRGQQNGP